MKTDPRKQQDLIAMQTTPPFSVNGSFSQLRECVGDGVPADSPALLLHDCFREYRELQKTYRWWNRKAHTIAMRSYNRALQRFHGALARHNGVAH